MDTYLSYLLSATAQADPTETWAQAMLSLLRVDFANIYRLHEGIIEARTFGADFYSDIVMDWMALPNRYRVDEDASSSMLAASGDAVVKVSAVDISRGRGEVALYSQCGRHIASEAFLIDATDKSYGDYLARIGNVITAKIILRFDNELYKFHFLRRGTQHFSKQEIARICDAVGHFRTAVRVRKHISTLDSEIRHQRLVMHHLPIPLAIVDAAGNILERNAAMEVLQKQRVMEDVSELGLHARDFRAALAAASRAQTTEPFHIYLSAGDRAEQLVLVAQRLSPTTRQGRFAGAVVVYALRTAWEDPALLDHLRRLFGLTLTEGRVAWRLVKGENTGAIATAMGIKPGTVRGHIKAIFAKSESHSQSDFLSRLLRAGVATLPLS